MNHWSSRRKRFIFLLVFTGFLILVGVPASFLFYQPPSCFDGKQNQGESGSDCGGPCALVCLEQALPIIPKGDPRIIEVAPEVYTVVAVVENPNVSAQAGRGRYVLRLFGSGQATPIKIIEDVTFVPRSSTFAVFEGPFNLPDAKPVRASLEWRASSLVWTRDTFEQPNLTLREIRLTREETEPRVTAVLVNNSQDRAEHIELVALVSDQEGNIITASKTFVSTVEGGKSVPVIFTWREPFESENVGVDILWRAFPDASYLR